MGRVSRYKRLKAVDPFSKRQHPSLDTSKYDQAPKPGEDLMEEAPSKRFLARSRFVQLGKDPAALKANMKPKKKLTTAERKAQQQLKPLPRESLKAFNERIKFLARQDISNHALGSHAAGTSDRKARYLAKKEARRAKQKEKKRAGGKADGTDSDGGEEEEEEEEGGGGGGGKGGGSGRGGGGSGGDAAGRARPAERGSWEDDRKGQKHADKRGKAAAPTVVRGPARYALDSRVVAAQQERDDAPLVTVSMPGSKTLKRPRGDGPGKVDKVAFGEVAERPPTLDAKQLLRILPSKQRQQLLMQQAAAGGDSKIVQAALITSAGARAAAAAKAALVGSSRDDGLHDLDPELKRARTLAVQRYADLRKQRRDDDDMLRAAKAATKRK